VLFLKHLTSRRPPDIQTGPAPECKVSEPDPAKNHGRRVLFAPGSDYPDSTHRRQKEGSVELTLVVGPDDRPHDVNVVKSFDKDFDTKAIQAVQRWRFEARAKEGQHVEMPIHVTLSFRTNFSKVMQCLCLLAWPELRIAVIKT
jgi:TonB family protein